MSTSTLVINPKTNVAYTNQQVAFTCETCGKEAAARLRDLNKRLLATENRYLCGECSWADHITKRTWTPRGPMSEEQKAKISTTKRMRGQPPMSKAAREQNARNLRAYNLSTKGQTLEARLGVEVTTRLRRSRSERMRGERNPQFGRPSHTKFNRHYLQGKFGPIVFRSNFELSFMVQCVAKGILFESCDQNVKYKIPYTGERGELRNYFPDFFLPESGEVVEVKPIWWVRNSPVVRLKTEAAIAWCVERGLTYKVVTEEDINLLTKEQQLDLEASNQITIFRRTEFC